MKELLKLFVIAMTLSLVLITAPTEGDGNVKAAAAEMRTCRPSDVSHFFTHALIAYPEIAFRYGNPMKNSYERDCLTVSEFKTILSSLYENGYALVDVGELYTVENGIAKPASFLFPANKKPIVFSFDDINYYEKKMHLGMNDKLIVSGGRLATFTRDAEQQINYDNETVTILENFIAAHPDFSYNGARGVLCLTGYDGIFGWRTQSTAENRTGEIAGAKEVVAALKKRGWRFASHSYGHGHMKQMSVDKFLSDVEKWNSEVEPLVGETQLYCYPYGEWEITENGAFTKKHQALIDSGFKLFFGVGADGYFGQVPFGRNSDKTLLMDRKPLDGYSLKAFSEKYSPYFNSKSVYASRERRNIPCFS